jgi:hypothetical protein
MSFGRDIGYGRPGFERVLLLGGPDKTVPLI